MEPLHLPSEEEINAAYNKRKEAVVALFYETFLKMAERPPRNNCDKSQALKIRS